MDRYRYNCNYCGTEYTPKRRFKQKYCSNSCRVNAFTQRKKAKNNLPDIKKDKTPITKDKMSWSGVGNAAAGTLATNLVTSMFTKEENKPATKGDIQKLLNNGFSKMVLIKNLPPRIDGTRAYFDTLKQVLIYK
ncbi:hypothetical protein [Thalassobellus suaedae]|uniref:Uncharacterized protein n=1 Tax=Thalassobellus suaedae TaxID=3074124 RepID=A0ABY9XP09_9FLAO|nr:hypothetical protein RHP51_10635 [Flavobacteriaceae bacterium HL-DH14]